MSTALQLNLKEYAHMVDVGAFDQLRRKVELIRGELREMNPAGPLHDALVVYLTNWSADHRDRAATRITSQTGLELPEQISRPEPDLMWLHVRSYRARHPAPADVQLAIEVSQSSLTYDLDEKRKLYAQAGIVEYWIVDATENCIHVFLEPSAGEYQVQRIARVGETLAPQIAPHAVLNLRQLFTDA